MNLPPFRYVEIPCLTGKHAQSVHSGMTKDEADELRAALRRSIELRTLIDASVAANESIDLVVAWEEVERLDHEIVRRIRKRAPE